MTASFYSARVKKVALSVMGAITPLLGFYLYGLAGYIFGASVESDFAFGAMWIMSFFIYSLLVLAGLIVGTLCPAKTASYKRFGLGLIAGPLIGFCFIGVENVLA